MTGYLILPDKSVYQLPDLISWEIIHTAGDGADAFNISFIYTPQMADMLRSAYRFRGVHDGKTVFFGVVDDFQVNIDGIGAAVSVTGRGLAALLLDNEAESVEYSTCTLNEILRVHVRPWGISDISADNMGSLSGYRVSSGVSQWQALAGFTRWVGNITPRFSKEGTLLITKKTDTPILITEQSGIHSMRWTKKRYGVISEVLVKGNTSGERRIIKNQDFLNKGGACRRVICVPNYTGYDAMRYTGEYQIRESQKNAETLELKMSEPFYAFAGDSVRLTLPSCGITGDFTVSQSMSQADGNGCGTTLTLTPEKGGS